DARSAWGFPGPPNGSRPARHPRAPSRCARRSSVHRSRCRRRSGWGGRSPPRSARRARRPRSGWSGRCRASPNRPRAPPRTRTPRRTRARRPPWPPTAKTPPESVANGRFPARHATGPASVPPPRHRRSARPSEDPRRDGGRAVQYQRVDRDVERAQRARPQTGKVLRRRQEPPLLDVADHPLRQLGELPEVLIAPKWAGPQRVSVGDGDLVDDDLTAVQGDLRAGTERLLRRIVAVVAPGPFGILDRRDLAPQRDGIGSMRPRRSIRPLVMPGA